MNKELQTTNSTLKNFISIIAHDHKNPFNTFIGFFDLLQTEFDSLTPEERERAIENTHKSALNAFSLLEQLLTWARLQTGTIQLEVTVLDLSQLIDEVMNLLQTAVFRNLISNAIKFTPDKGSIDVTAIEKTKTIQLVFRDSGVGISGEGLRRLFSIDDLYKTSGTNGKKGTGIGLLLCRDYLKKNHGNITVESVEGKGTTFRVTFPKAIS